MKKILITQDIIYAKSYLEKRDSISHLLLEFLQKNNYHPILVPNNLMIFKKLINNIKFEGVILSGGNDLGSEKNRDFIEKKLISYSVKKNIPILGICRGMQIIAKFHGVKLHKTSNHANKKHYVTKSSNNKLSKLFNKTKVNSFHNFYIKKTNKKFENLLLAPDNSIESFKIKNKDIFGVMWHPERMNSKKSNILIKKIFK